MDNKEITQRLNTLKGNTFDLDKTSKEAYMLAISDAKKLFEYNSSLCDCSAEKLEHIEDKNSYPYGAWVEYDRCKVCGELYNFMQH